MLNNTVCWILWCYNPYLGSSVKVKSNRYTGTACQRHKHTLLIFILELECNKTFHWYYRNKQTKCALLSPYFVQGGFFSFCSGIFGTIIASSFNISWMACEMTLLKSDILHVACLKHTIIWNLKKFLHGLECLPPFMMGISEVSFKTVAAHTGMCCLTIWRLTATIWVIPHS